MKLSKSEASTSRSKAKGSEEALSQNMSLPKNARKEIVASPYGKRKLKVDHKQLASKKKDSYMKKQDYLRLMVGEEDAANDEKAYVEDTEINENSFSFIPMKSPNSEGRSQTAKSPHFDQHDHGQY